MGFWIRSRRKGDAALDWWSLVHLAGGAAVGLLPFNWLWAVGLIVGFEALEAVLRRIKTGVHSGGLFEHESWPNIVADVIIGLAGYGIVHHAVGPLVPWPWDWAG